MRRTKSNLGICEIKTKVRLLPGILGRAVPSDYDFFGRGGLDMLHFDCDADAASDIKCAGHFDIVGC